MNKMKSLLIVLAAASIAVGMMAAPGTAEAYCSLPRGNHDRHLYEMCLQQEEMVRIQKQQMLQQQRQQQQQQFCQQQRQINPSFVCY